MRVAWTKLSPTRIAEGGARVRAYCGSRISPHLSRTPEGFLVCHSVPICRTGNQQYTGAEIGISTDDKVTVFRPEREVLNAKTIASFEAKPITDDHPPTFLRPENWSYYARGHCQNVREGPRLENGERCLIADLIISDDSLISKIQSGKRAVSCGYECSYSESEDGSFEQSNIVGNHIAIVAEARAGAGVRIMDSKGKLTPDELLNRIEEIVAHANSGKPLLEGSKLLRNYVADAFERDAAQAKEFEVAARRYFRKRISVHHEPPPTGESTPRRRAEDAALSYEEAIRVVRRRMLEGK